jgi:SAM-dependent methyltransferase
VLDKIKKIFMKKEKIGEMRIPTDELQKEVEALENQEEELTEIEATPEELQEMEDVDYLEKSPIAVGFNDQQSQYDDYQTITEVIPAGDSILDFGCGRGDYCDWAVKTYEDDLDYIGIDANQVLIDAGKKIYEDIDIRCDDWNNLDKDVIQDWCININSNNIRYDFDTNKSDIDYLYSTLDKMYEHARNGIIIMLPSTMTKEETNSIKYDPGVIFNHAQAKFGNAVIDHTDTDSQFILTIYKNEN